MMRAAMRTGLLLAACATASAHPRDEFDYCTTCHGADANGNVAVRAPKLTGMQSWYAIAQLDAFRRGWRGLAADDAPGREMQPVATALPNASALARAVAYVVALPPRAPVATVTGDLAHGAALYVTCAVCHGARAQGDETLGAPALTDQNDWYLVAQIHDFRDGRRGQHADDVRGASMRAAALGLDDTAIVDVVAYVATLTPHTNVSRDSTEETVR